jgi:hypothetical protein
MFVIAALIEKDIGMFWCAKVHIKRGLSSVIDRKSRYIPKYPRRSRMFSLIERKCPGWTEDGIINDREVTSFLRTKTRIA